MASTRRLSDCLFESTIVQIIRIQKSKKVKYEDGFRIRIICAIVNLNRQSERRHEESEAKWRAVEQARMPTRFYQAVIDIHSQKK